MRQSATNQAPPAKAPDTPEGKCPYCHSANVKNNGFVYVRDRITKKQIKTDKPRMKCNDCGKGWSLDPTEAKFGQP